VDENKPTSTAFRRTAAEDYKALIVKYTNERDEERLPLGQLK